jgi:hypothetical protein
MPHIPAQLAAGFAHEIPRHISPQSLRQLCREEWAVISLTRIHFEHR